MLFKLLGERTCLWFRWFSTQQINYDINVPLNLGPAYAWRALDDIRLIAQKQNPATPFAGLFLFESGWEFG
jgi:hypothetical protein